MESVVLNVFKGDWGLASIDLDCLIQLAYSKLANAPVDFNFNGRPFLSPTGFLPYSSLPSAKLCSYDDFTGYLKKHNFDPNKNLSTEEKSLSLSYQHQLRSSLYPYFIFTLIDNERNFLVIRKLYGQRIAFPFSLFYPGKLERMTREFKETTYGIVTDEKDTHDVHQKATIEARIFLNSISKRMGQNLFFFGSKPCEFDAHLYAYLAILSYCQLPENPIKSHILQCPNLVAYVKRITKRYFAEEAHDSGTVYEFSAYGKPAADNRDAVEDKKNRRFQILAAAFAVGMMTVFSLTSGIFEHGNFSRRLENITTLNDDDDEDGDDGA